MSSTIEFNRQFIKSESGITPCWQCGDNRTFRGYGRHMRYARDWSVFYNLLGVNEETIIDAVRPTLGGYNEHWLKNGKWVDDIGLIRWIKAGCAKAASIEEILRANGMRAVDCHLSVWEGYDDHEELRAYVKNTVEFDVWLRKAEDRIAELKLSGARAFPIIGWPEDFNAPQKSGGYASDDKVLLKDGRYYYTKSDEHGVYCSSNIKEALVLTYAEALLLQQGHRSLRRAKIVNADCKKKPYNAIIYIAGGPHAGSYIAKSRRGGMSLVPNESYARRYPDKAGAKAAIKRLEQKFRSDTFSVVMLEAEAGNA